MRNIEVSPELIVANIEAMDREAVFTELAGLLQENGFVKESFLEAIIEREKVFPTGLMTESANVAIPHTDAEHVRKPGIAIGILDSPVEFGLMGSPGETVQVKVIFMLAITEPEMQVRLLGNLTDLFQDNALMTELSGMIDEKGTLRLIRSFFDEAKVKK